MVFKYKRRAKNIHIEVKDARSSKFQSITQHPTPLEAPSTLKQPSLTPNVSPQISTTQRAPKRSTLLSNALPDTLNKSYTVVQEAEPQVLSRWKRLKSEAPGCLHEFGILRECVANLSRGGSSGRADGKGDGAAEVLEVVDVVELNIDALDEPLAALLLGVEDGDSADTVGGDGGLGEGGGPDEGDLLAVEGANLLDLDRDQVGRVSLVAHESSLRWEDGGAEGEAGDVVDGLGLVVEVLREEVLVLGLPQGEDVLVVAEDDIDVGLAQALLLGGADVDAVADDDGGGGGGRAGKGGDGEGLEETHLD